MMTAKIRMAALVFVAILSVGSTRQALATPVIKEFSSTGGNPTNKTGLTDTMYLVRPGDKITFTIKAKGAEKYQWQVNKKVDTKAAGEKFTWAVPEEKGIWEIHLTVSSDKEDAHQEWVVSTLSKKEAPDFFDYFADGKYLGKKYLGVERAEKDPWGRTLPQWRPTHNNPKYSNTLDASRGFLRRTSDGSSFPINVDMTIPCGTWKFRYRFPDSNTGQWGLDFEYLWSSRLSQNRQCHYSKRSDGHHHCTVPIKRASGVYKFSYEYDGAGWVEDGKWHQVTIIRTPKTWLYVFNDDIFEFYVQDKLDITPEKIVLGLERRKGHEVYFDNLEVYKDKYLFPKAEVTYRKYTWNYYASKYRYYPEMRDGIVVRGRNIRLADIAKMLNDPSRFSYDAKTKTAICNADLIIYDASEFVMQGETLKFNCKSDGQWHFVIRYGANVKIENSTVTTTGDHYFIWNNACSTTHFGRPNHPDKWIHPIEFQRVGVSYGVMVLGNAGAIRFTAKNSVINNTAHIFFDSPMELDITDMKFTNLRELDIGNYKGLVNAGRCRERLFPKGNKSFWVYTDEVNTNKFNFRNVSFSGKTGPINVTFLINALRDKLNVYDLDLKNENIVIKKSLPQLAGQSHTWAPYRAAGYKAKSYGGRGLGMDSKLGLVNCKFKSLIVPTNLAWGIPKYYMDVKVVDKQGRPVRNAKVRITNEVDNVNYPAENMAEKQQVFDPKLPKDRLNTYFYLSYQIIHGFANSSTVTEADGRTPLPKDVKNTVILTDYVQDKDGKKEFTYTITIEKDGKKKVITGVNPGPGWYRPKANNPTYTITAVLDGATVTEAELKEKNLAGAP